MYIVAYILVAFQYGPAGLQVVDMKQSFKTQAECVAHVEKIKASGGPALACIAKSKT